MWTRGKKGRYSHHLVVEYPVVVGKGRKYKDEAAERCDTELIAGGDRQTLTRNINIDARCVSTRNGP